MYEPIHHILLDKFRWFIIGMLILLGTLLMFSFLLPAAETNTTVATDSLSGNTIKVYDSPNVVTNVMAMAADTISGSVTSATQAIDSGGRSAAATISQGGGMVAHSLHTGVSSIGHGISGGAAFMGRTVSHSAMSIGHGLIAGVTFVGHSLSNSAVFMVHIASNTAMFIISVPGSILNVATETASVSAFIKPAENMPTPKIDPVVSIAPATSAPLPAAAPVRQASLPPDSAAMWPIHGKITTPFGVPHWPYQPTHTGIDISDGQRSGVTAVKPFKPGRVEDVVRYYSGLGNHVIVDHGEGVTSVYGHLASISVQPGQAVDKSTILGLEGSTGASTGTHLHFEIRLNGQPVNPQQFVNGQP